MFDIDYFYADPHFGHRNIIDLCHRPFDGLDDMHAELIERYNDTVDDQDTVCFVGDVFFMKHEPAAEILRLLNGQKILVVGNHDRSPRKMVEMGFAMATDEMFIHLVGHTVRVNHYPYRTKDTEERLHDVRPHRHPDEFLIHGHTHDLGKGAGREIHVGVDAWDFRPVHRKEVEDIILERT